MCVCVMHAAASAALLRSLKLFHTISFTCTTCSRVILTAFFAHYLFLRISSQFSHQRSTFRRTRALYGANALHFFYIIYRLKKLRLFVCDAARKHNRNDNEKKKFLRGDKNNATQIRIRNGEERKRTKSILK